MDTGPNCADGPEPSSPSPTIHPRPACDNCRIRKIRCDRQCPCGHCVNVGIDCTLVGKKPREKRMRILVTPQYEKKIDQLDHRLERVFQLIQDIKNGHQSSASSHTEIPSPAGAATSSKPSPSSGNVQTGSSAMLGVAGESSLAAHSTFASNFMHQVAISNPLPNSESEMRDALDALSNVVATLREQVGANEMVYPHARPIQRPGPSGYTLPPIQKAVELIRIARNRRLVGTGFIYEFVLVQPFSDICLQVYFSGDFSDMEYIIVNAGLYSLFADYSHHVSAEEKAFYLDNAYMCRANLETALSDLPLHLPTTPDAITALIFGGWHAMELSKPHLSWALSNKASEICQTLGYHRMPDTSNDDGAKFRKFLFWTNYFLDKSLSLRLGRSSTIPDRHITTHRPSISDSHSEPATAYFVLWVEAARCQGNIYEMLYSPEAVVQPDHVRQSRTQLLVNSLRMLAQATQETHNKWIHIAKDNAGEDLMDFFAISDDILRLSLLTLVYRAAPRPASASTTFSPSCVETARATLHRHQDCLEIIEKSGKDFLSAYVHWTLLFAPFIPFIVIFCQVIETQDRTDLDLLGAFSTSIQPAAAASDAAAKLYRIFKALHRVAVRYIEISTPYDGQPRITDEMDMYLRMLGMSSTVESSGHEQHMQGVVHEPDGNLAQAAGVEGVNPAELHAWPMVTNPMMRMGNETQLEEWFLNNQALMESFQTSGHDYPT